MKKINLAVFDLDGTLITINSFPKWVKYILVYSALKSPMVFAQLVSVILRRLMRFYGRVEMKRKIIKISNSLPISIHEKFSNSLHKYLNKEVLEHLERLKEVDDIQIVLSTAAPDVYVTPLADHLNIPISIATSSVVNDAWFEHFGAKKWETLEERFGSEYFQITEFFSDDYHDIPLMHHADRIYLVNPTSLSVEAIRQSGIEICDILGAIQSHGQENV